MRLRDCSRIIAPAAAASLLTLGILACAKAPPFSEEASLKGADGRRIPIAEMEVRITELMDRAVVAGLGCAILNDGHVVYHNSFGFRDMDAREPLGPDAVFNAASLSKPVFAYLVARLVEEGRIDLDRPLHEYLPQPLPEYESYSDLRDDDRWREVTARMVLSHTTGFPNWRLLTDDHRLVFLFDPGSRFSYSGEGIQLLQEVVEEISGEDLEALARDRVFGPLGMHDTSYVWQPSYAGRYALPHNRYGWPADPNRRSTPQAAGSMVTTAVDYGRFLEAVLTREREAPPGGVRMTAPVISITTERMFGPGSWSDGPSGDSVDISWGLGWGLFDGPRGRASFHTGHDSGAQNFAVSLVEEGIGVVLLSNSDNFESVAPELVEATIGDTGAPFKWLGYGSDAPISASTPPPRPPRIDVAAETIAPYAGTYRLTGGPTFRVRADGSRLLMSDDGEYWDEIIPESDTRFRVRGRLIVLEFVPAPGGTVDRIDIDLEGRRLTAERIE